MDCELGFPALDFKIEIDAPAELLFSGSLGAKTNYLTHQLGMGFEGTTTPDDQRLIVSRQERAGESSSVKRFDSGRPLTSQVEQKIAWIFMNLGEWVEQDVKAIIDDGKLVAIEFSWMPNERENDGFEMIGTLSRMFSRYYTQQTSRTPDSVQIELEHRPNWFAPLISSEYKSDTLPLWRFVQKPATAQT